jgi:pimeloyl-ACP methyl ester carboxylesterase
MLEESSVVAIELAEIELVDEHGRFFGSSPRSWAERAYPKLIHYNKVEKGGHFAAWEQPQLFSEEVRAGFRPLRK